MKVSSVAIVGLLSMFSTGIAQAGTNSWSYSSYVNGGYVPKSGSFIESIIGGQYSCRTTFTLDSYNVSQISDYNNGGDNPGTTNCENANAYLTLDQSAVPGSWDLEIDADSVATTLPNPKIDLEDDNFFGERNESEVVVLGSVSAGIAYAMRTYWNDYRDGDNGDGGNIQVQFAMSKHGLNDYNNCVLSEVVQIINAYGSSLGSL